MALIKAEKLALGYEGRIVVSGINFTVNEGDYLCIVGENGSGKSTLMKALLTLEKPVTGKIYYGDGLKKNEIGYLPQRTAQDVDFPASVYEVVMSGCINKRGFFRAKANKALAEKNMQRMRITDIARRPYRELSGGQMQRVLLARALCAADKVLLLDEPVSGLDPVVTKELYEIVRELNKEGLTVIMVTHDTEPIVNDAKTVLHLNETQCFFGSRDEYFASDAGRLFTANGGGKDA